MMGKNNPDLQRGLESVFECKHLDWTEVPLPVPIPDTDVAQEPVMKTIERVHGFNIHNPSGEPRTENRIPTAREVVGILEDAASKPIKTIGGSSINPFDVILMKTFNEFKPDIVFMHLQRGGVLSQESVDEMKKTAMLISWCGDVREELPQHYIDLGKHISLTLFTNMEDVWKLRKAGVKADFLQVGFDSQNFNPEGSINDKIPEIIFMGSNYQHQFPLSSYRESMVKRLKNEFGDRFGVYGSNWGTISNGLITNYAEEGQAYRSCKIAISLSHFERTKYASDRLFRILGSGPFCLTHTYPELEKDFEPEVDLDVFTSIDDLVSKIKYYLKNEELRKKIAIEGCRRARQNFTWHHFAENLKILTDKK